MTALALKPPLLSPTKEIKEGKTAGFATATVSVSDAATHPHARTATTATAAAMVL